LFETLNSIGPDSFGEEYSGKIENDLEYLETPVGNYHKKLIKLNYDEKYENSNLIRVSAHQYGRYA